MKKGLILLLTLFVSGIVAAQDEDWGKWVKALMKGDTILAAQIERRHITTEPIEEKKFPQKNIPEHVFHMKMAALKDSIVSFFSMERQMDNRILKPIFYSKRSVGIMQVIFHAETKENALFGKEYFSAPGTGNDIYLNGFGDVWLSKLYCSKGKALEIETDFVIKLTSIDDSLTRVTIVATNPIVFNGTKGFGVHGPVARETAVPSSSIEEYTLLLFIADKLKEHSLLRLKLPAR